MGGGHCARTTEYIEIRSDINRKFDVLTSLLSSSSRAWSPMEEM